MAAIQCAVDSLIGEAIMPPHRLCFKSDDCYCATHLAPGGPGFCGGGHAALCCAPTVSSSTWDTTRQQTCLTE